MGLLGDSKDVGSAALEVGKAAMDPIGHADPQATMPVLLGGQKTIAGMQRTTGFGSPDDGERFGEGASRFNDAGGTLAAAYPSDSWTGRGSESYSNANSRQIDRTQAMADTDQSIHAVLAREATQISATRAVLDEQSDWLADVGLITRLVAATPYVGRSTALALEIAAVTRALGECTTQLTKLSEQVSANAAEIQQLGGRYGTDTDTEPAGG